MITERQIIYTMLETLKGGEFNNDESLGERLLRNYLSKHRADLMRKHYRNGVNVDPEVFQLLQIELTPALKTPANSKLIAPSPYSEYEYKGSLPKIIRFPKNTGYYIEKDGFGIPIVDPSEYRSERRNFNTSFQPKGKVISNDISIYIGDLESKYITINSEMYFLIKSIKDSISNTTKKLKLDLFCVLQNPSDDPNYNWKTDIYPFPAERINELINQIYQKEFGVIVQAKPDEIQNARADKVIYHQNDDVNQN